MALKVVPINQLCSVQGDMGACSDHNRCAEG